jgi:hypothetical protein
MRIPKAKSELIKKARRVDMRPCSSINPTIRGILAKWQGLKRMLKTPQAKEAAIAIKGVPSTERESNLNSASIT